MDATAALQVAIELPPELHESVDDVADIITSIFGGETYDVNVNIVRASRLTVNVLVPVKINPSHETSILKYDDVASSLIKFRIMQTIEK